MNFAIFAGERYYAAGGGNDLISQAPTAEEAVEMATRLLGGTLRVKRYRGRDSIEWDINIEWVHVVNLETGEIVFRVGEGPHGEHIITGVRYGT